MRVGQTIPVTIRAEVTAIRFGVWLVALKDDAGRDTFIERVEESVELGYVGPAWAVSAVLQAEQMHDRAEDSSIFSAAADTPFHDPLLLAQAGPVTLDFRGIRN